MQDFSRLIRNTSRTKDYLLHMSGAIVVAFVVIALAKIADMALHFSEDLFAVYPWAFLIIMPLGFGLIRYVTVRWAPYAAGSGIPQTMAAVRIKDVAVQTKGLLNPLQTLLKVFLVTLGLACGASIGREGPSIQVGAAAMAFWAYRLAGRLRVSAESLVIAGGAGGLAAAFNTPLAGIVFAMEELAKGRAIRATWFVLMTILGAGFISLAVQGNYDFFPIFDRSDATPSLVVLAVFSALVGLVAGLMSWLLVTGLPRYLPEASTAWRAAALAAAIGFVLAVLVLLTDGSSLGTGYQTAAGLLNADPAVDQRELGFSLVKFIATVLSYVAGIPGGIFTPSLSIGAGLGHDFSIAFGLQGLHQHLVLIGMVAFLAGVVQAPVTATVIVMEMTGSQDAFIYLMLAAVIANLTSKIICRQSIYEILARRLLETIHPAQAARMRREHEPESANQADSSASPSNQTNADQRQKNLWEEKH
ncbi:MAG: chloride channel protein [Burkholderiaceae bacterium]